MSDARLHELLSRVHLAPDRRAAVIEKVRLIAQDSDSLRRELSSYIYSVMHAGQATGHEYVPFHHRDLEFESALLGVTPRPFRSAEVPLIEQVEEAAHVRFGGLRVRVPRERIDRVDRDNASAHIQTIAARPLLSPGFLLVDGVETAVGHGNLLRAYVHVASAEHAVAVWRRALDTLEHLELPYRIKILSSPQQFPRRDALVIYLNEPDPRDLDHLTAAMQDQPGLGDQTSPFAQRVAPGIAIAHEPVDPRPALGGLSFGQHRSRVLADAIWDASLTGTDPLEALKIQCGAANVWAEEPAFNATPVPLVFS